MITLFRLSAVAALLLAETTAASAQSLINVSSLASAGPGTPLTSGFVIANGATKTVLIRAIGPTLAAYGVLNVLPHPVLSVFPSGSTTAIAGNDTWGGTAALTTVFQQVGAFALPANSLDAAVVATLPAGAYSAQVTSKTGATGNCLIEIYDVSGTGSQLINLSTLLTIGANPPTFGFVISGGSGTRTLLIRNVGPSLTQFGVTSPLASTNLTVFSSATPAVAFAQNTGWTTGNVTSLSLSFTAAGAFPLLAGSADSAVVANFPPGAYGVSASGNGGATGTALVEIYDITPSGPNLVALTATHAAADNSGTNPGTFAVTRVGSLVQPLTVNYLVGGSAVSGVNYASLPGTVTIAAGASSATITVNPYPTVNAPPSTTATLTLLSGTGYTIGAPATATVTITELASTLYTANLRPPASSSSTASGTATILLDPSNTFALVNVSFANLSSSEVVGHLEIGTAGQGGSPVFNLSPGQVVNQQWTFTAAGPYSIAQLVSALKSGSIFVEIDTANYPSGELTGGFIQSAGSQTFSAPAPAPALPASSLGPSTDATNAVRLLSQATFGPTTASLSAVMTQGVSAWIASQIALPASSQLAAVRADAAAFPNPQDPNSATYYYTQNVNIQAAWWKLALTAPDQLRQRVAFALSEIFVASIQGAGLNTVPEAMASYYDLLAADAFGNYRQLLQDVTLSPVMGTYLNMLQNQKSNPAAGTSADENYAREVQQLFTIGLNQLQPDGTLQLDVNGQPIPTYNNTTIVQTANALTGWAFASPNNNFFYSPLSTAVFGAPFASTNAFLNPMTAYSAYHDTTQKTIVGGVVIPAGGTAASDLKVVLDTLFNHQNAGPFFCRQLIQHLVTSNPSPAYVYRVAQVFANDGTGTRGNLAAVVTAVLSDYEARSGALLANAGYGKLREPLLRITGILRALNATSANGRYIEFVSGGTGNGPYLASPLGDFEEASQDSPTVFNFFAPGYVLPGALAAAGLVAPEFQITDAYSSIEVPNALYTYTFNRVTPQAAPLLALDFSSLTALAPTPAALLAQVSLLFCNNGMTAATNTRIQAALTSLGSSATPLALAQTAVFLATTSSEAAIQR